MKTGLSISNDAMGAFIDAVYAIAVTILALELPKTLDSDDELVRVAEMLVYYGIAFSVLFALWVQHRRINIHIDSYRPSGLWLNAAILMLVCLIPRATSFVFENGGQVDFTELETSTIESVWTLSTVIDLSYIAIILLSDLGLVALLHLMPKETRASEAADIYRSKLTITILLILVMSASLFLPVENRYFLVILPVFLIFEHRIAAFTRRLRKDDQET